MSANLVHQKRPCDECPWRRDVPVGRFPPERFAVLADTARDMSLLLFACHKSAEGKDAACAGFLLRGADHNLTVRMAKMQGRVGTVDDAGLPLYAGYTEMAQANGVDPADLRGVRS